VVHVAVLELAGLVHRLASLGSLFTAQEDCLLYIDTGFGIVAMVLGLSVAEWFGGATVGKWLCGMRVVATGGGSPTYRGTTRRNLALLLDLLFFGLVAYSAMARSERRQRVGDDWGDTVVVWRRAAPGRPALGGALLGVVTSLLVLLLSYIVVA